MVLRFAALLFVALLVVASVGTAQTAAELLQKGAYTQRTAGDVDSAIEIYRQAIGGAGNDRALAASAQMQLVSAFLQKGDLPGASREFSTLMLSYADQKEVISAMSGAMQAAGSVRPHATRAPGAVRPHAPVEPGAVRPHAAPTHQPAGSPVPHSTTR